MARALHVISLIPRVVLIILMIIMLVDMMLGVFFRYVVGQALPWSEEVGTLSLIWLTFVGGAIGITRGSHFAIHLFLERLGPWQAADAPDGHRPVDHAVRAGAGPLRAGADDPQLHLHNARPGAQPGGAIRLRLRRGEC